MDIVGRMFSSVSDFYKDLNPSTLSGAIDVIVIEQPDGSLACSPFHVRFGKLHLLRPQEKIVEVTVNGELSEFSMKVGEAGEAFFTVAHVDDGSSGGMVNSNVSGVSSISISSSSISTGNKYKSNGNKSVRKVTGITGSKLKLSKFIDCGSLSDTELLLSHSNSLSTNNDTSSTFNANSNTNNTSTITNDGSNWDRAVPSLEIKGSTMSDTELDYANYDNVPSINSTLTTDITVDIANTHDPDLWRWKWGSLPRQGTRAEIVKELKLKENYNNGKDRGVVNTVLDEDLSTFDSSTISTFDRLWEMSLCGINLTLSNANEEFEKNIITYEMFAKSQDIINDHRLVFRFKKKHYYTWQFVSPIFTSQAIFQNSPSLEFLKSNLEKARTDLLKDDLKKTQDEKIGSFTDGWKSWWTRSATISAQQQKPPLVSLQDNSTTRSTGVGDVGSPSSPSSSSSLTPSGDKLLGALSEPSTSPKRQFAKDDGKQRHSISIMKDLKIPSSDQPSTSSSILSSFPKQTYTKTLRLTSDQLKRLKLRYGANDVSFTVNSSYSGRATCTAKIYLWRNDVQVVISDIDGTITKSDALGHLFSMVGKDWTHVGIAKLYTQIQRNGYQFLFLTSRAIGQADWTRMYLRGIEQGKYTLPDGPVIMSPDRLIAALKREVIDRRPEEFKIAALTDIRRLFAGKNPFYAGFGNRITDALSYRAVDIPAYRIYSIDPNGNVKMDFFYGYSSSYVKLTDLVDHIFPHLSQRKRIFSDSLSISSSHTVPLTSHDFNSLNSSLNNAWNSGALDTHDRSRSFDTRERSLSVYTQNSEHDLEREEEADAEFNDWHYWRNPPVLADILEDEDSKSYNSSEGDDSLKGKKSIGTALSLRKPMTAPVRNSSTSIIDYVLGSQVPKSAGTSMPRSPASGNESAGGGGGAEGGNSIGLLTSTTRSKSTSVIMETLSRISGSSTTLNVPSLLKNPVSKTPLSNDGYENEGEEEEEDGPGDDFVIEDEDGEEEEMKGASGYPYV